MSEQKTRHIVELRAENVKRLRAVTITPDGSLVVVGGRNAQGKSSVLDAIAMALGGLDKAPERPVRHGESKAEVVVDLGDLVVRRVFDARGSRLEVRGADGQKVASPQALLDRLTGRLTFDPLEFLRMDGAARARTPMGLAGIDPEEYEAERDRVYMQRRDANREVGRLKAVLSEMPHTAPGVPKERPDTAAAAQKMEQIEQARRARDAANIAIARKQDVCEQRRRNVARQSELLRTLRSQVLAAEKNLEALKQADSDEQKELADLIAHRDTATPEPPDASEIREELRRIQEAVRRYEANQAWEKTAGELREADGVARTLGASLHAIDERKQKALAAVPIAVEGLTVSAGNILIDGIPFDQCSASEQLRTSIAMGLALNPAIKVLLIRDGSYLDDSNLALVAEMAKAADAQVWIERVGDDGTATVVIENGEVAAR